MESPSYVRASRYGIDVTNYDLISLQSGQYLSPKIMWFFVEYFKEKVETNWRKKKYSKIWIAPSKFFHELVPPNQGPIY